ncbi:Permeases of the major facilitator superfamily [Novosphingobium sp. Rr 2-17]|uniref:MFS transporter n=1 Tax=Novosphingobium sp. Rr 2-17 TaxID=555793 RepID=UPI0002697BAC|nr:MFS transporter [Novosphingobium sp. Rr 2-17]EIZ78344.1 Permeases of the major facilitator superfamily [Novosphingobium sp. Rr 2-17]
MNNQRWVVLAVLSYMLSLGMALPIYAGSVVNTFMVVDMGWSRQTLGLLVAVNMIVSGLMAPAGAVVVNRFGIRRPLIAGAVLMGVLALVMATLVTAAWQAVLVFSVGMGVASNLTGIVTCQTGISQWFEDKRTTALSVLYAAMGVGGFGSVWLVTRVIESTHAWRTGWAVFMGAAVVGVALTLLLVRDKADSGAGVPAGTAPLKEALDRPGRPPVGASAAAGQTLGDALRSPFLWAVCLCMLAAMADGAFLTAHVQAYLRDTGFDPAAAAAAVSVFSLATLGGNLAIGAIAPRVAPRVACAASLLIFAAAFLVLAHVSGALMLNTYAVIAGFAFGALQVGNMAMFGHYWTAALFPSLTALGLLTQTAGGGVVPIVAGAYFDAHHTYLPVIMTLIAFNILSAAILMLTRPPGVKKPRVEQARGKMRHAAF